MLGVGYRGMGGNAAESPGSGSRRNRACHELYALTLCVLMSSPTVM